MSEEQKQKLREFVKNFQNTCEIEEFNFDNYVRAIDLYTFCNDLLKLLE